MTCSSTHEPNKLHTELEQGLCKEWPEGHAARQRKRGRRTWQGHAGPFGPASSESPPPPSGGTESSPALAVTTRQAGRKQVHWNGFLLPPYLQRAWVSSSNGQTCWRPPFPGDTHCPSAGHFANCLAIIVRGPKSATRCWWPRAWWSEESARPGSTHLSGRGVF